MKKAEFRITTPHYGTNFYVFSPLFGNIHAKELTWTILRQGEELPGANQIQYVDFLFFFLLERRRKVDREVHTSGYSSEIF